MPWVMRETYTPAARRRRRMQRWLYDHGPALTSASIGGACAAATLVLFKVLGLIG